MWWSPAILMSGLAAVRSPISGAVLRLQRAFASRPEPDRNTHLEESGVMLIDRLDHFVLTVADIDATCAFYERALGMTVVTFGSGGNALAFGRQKINLHQAGREFEPKALRPTPGSADFCLIATAPLDEVMAHLQACGIEIE